MAFGGVGVFPISKLLCRFEECPPPPSRFLYRASHKDSAGSFDGKIFASASWRMKGDVFLYQWMYDEPEAHFSSHFDLENREPTMFLSTIDSLMRTLNIACRFYKLSSQSKSVTRTCSIKESLTFFLPWR
jgi:hypothetical protein